MTLSNKIILAILAFSLVSCADDEKQGPPDPKAPPLYMLYSPNGEPLNGGPLGKVTCEQAMDHWFDRMNTSGIISKDAFLSDAHTQFTRMDIDHNGYIVSEELDRFRAPYRQQPPAQKQEAQNDTQNNKHGHSGKSGHKNDGGSNQSDLSYTTADPVMSADTNLDFKVSPEEFIRHAEYTFTQLDSNHNGTLERAEITAGCHQKQP